MSEIRRDHTILLPAFTVPGGSLTAEVIFELVDDNGQPRDLLVSDVIFVMDQLQKAVDHIFSKAVMARRKKE